MDFTVAIVGRPNVGKSTLFNRLVGEKTSIVDDKPGITRDRIYGTTEWNGKDIILIDTGGIEPYSKDVIFAQMKRQADFAVEASDVILFLVDAKDGITSSDEEVAHMLRRSGKPIVLVANKVDNFSKVLHHFEFYSLGLGEPVLISAAHGLAIGDMLDKVIQHMSVEEGLKKESDAIKIAVVGKPNVGKSSLVNAILGEERVIVSHIPGTTRDAIDTSFVGQGHKMTIIDTAGLRRKSKIEEDVEYYSTVRAKRAIERADIVVMVIDGTESISEQDKRIAGMAHDLQKGIVIAVNKWDVVDKDDSTDRIYTKEIRKEFIFTQYAPIVFISAKTGLRVNKVIEKTLYVWDQYNHRVKTSALNNLLQEATAIVEPPNIKGRRLRIYYSVQGGTRPPSFIFFVNDRRLLHFSYSRYLENQIREKFKLDGTPIDIIAKTRKRD